MKLSPFNETDFKPSLRQNQLRRNAGAGFVKFVRLAGVEPASAAWKAAIIATIRQPHASRSFPGGVFTSRLRL